MLCDLLYIFEGSCIHVVFFPHDYSDGAYTFGHAPSCRCGLALRGMSVVWVKITSADARCVVYSDCVFRECIPSVHWERPAAVCEDGERFGTAGF